MRNITSQNVVVNFNDDRCDRTNVGGKSVVRGNGILAPCVYLHLTLGQKRHFKRRFAALALSARRMWPAPMTATPAATLSCTAGLSLASTS